MSTETETIRKHVQKRMKRIVFKGPAVYLSDYPLAQFAGWFEPKAVEARPGRVSSDAATKGRAEGVM